MSTTKQRARSFPQLKRHGIRRLRDEWSDVTYEEFEGRHEVPEEIGTAALDWFLS